MNGPSHSSRVSIAISTAGLLIVIGALCIAIAVDSGSPGQGLERTFAVLLGFALGTAGVGTGIAAAVAYLRGA